MYYGLAGAAIGIASLFKYPIGVLVLLLAVSVLLGLVSATDKPVQRLVLAMALFAGFMLPVVGCYLAMSIQGNLSEFLWIQFTYIPGYVGRGSGTSETFWDKVSTVAIILTLIVPYGIGNLTATLGVLAAKRRGKLSVAMPLVMWWLAALIHLIAQNKYYAYHALPLLAPQALLTTLALASWKPVAKNWMTHVVMAAPVLVAALVAAPAINTLSALATAQQQWNVVYDNQRYISTNGDFSAPADSAVAYYVNTMSRPDETVFVWGFEPAIYFLAARHPATRFIYNFPLYGAYAEPGLREQFYQQLEHAAPRYILVVKNDAMIHVTGTNEDSATAFAHDQRLRGFVAANYTLETVIEDFTVYRRR